jgi:hypothetical protein
MVRVLRFFVALLAWLRSSQARRDAEILYLRHQLIVLITTNPTAEWIARQITEAFPPDRRPVTSCATEK